MKFPARLLTGVPGSSARQVCGELGDVSLLGCEQPPLGDVSAGAVQQGSGQRDHH